MPKYLNQIKALKKINKSTNYKGKPIEIICDGEIYKSYAALAKAYNLNVTTVSRRISRNGWTPEQAVLKKSVVRKTTGHKIVVAGKTYSSQKKQSSVWGGLTQAFCVFSGLGLVGFVFELF